MMGLSDLDRQALFVKSERIDEICLDMKERLAYFCRQKRYAPLEYLLSCLQFAACGVVSFSEGDLTKDRDFVDLFREAIKMARDQEDIKEIKAFWPDGTEVT